jgi:hypothetical protein
VVTQVVSVQIRPSAPIQGSKRTDKVQKPASRKGLAGFLLPEEIHKIKDRFNIMGHNQSYIYPQAAIDRKLKLS